MKKLLVILGMIACMAGLAACGEEEQAEDRPITEEQAVEFGEAVVEQINMIVSSDALEQYADDPILYSGFLSWKDALEEIGTFEGTNGGTVQYGEEIAISINALGSDHDAVVELILSNDMMSYVGITTNVQYTTGEIMLKAGMNTLIGMGTVFAVLILISLIISCFSLISKIEAKQKKKAESLAPAPAAAPVVQQTAAAEELSDDTELVAVIAAAIAAYEGSASTDGFVVRSIRKSNKTKWQNA